MKYANPLKVRCIKDDGAVDLTLGKIYKALGEDLSMGAYSLYDDGEDYAYLYPKDAFEVVN